MDELIMQALSHVNADNVIGALCLLGLFDVRRVLRRMERHQRRQERRDREKGGGGELDALYAKLAVGTLTPLELTQMLRLERGL